MEPIRDFVQSIGLQAEDFNTLIIVVVIVGGIWAAIRIFRDLTGAGREFFEDKEEERHAGH